MKPIFIVLLSEIDPDVYKVIVVIFIIVLVMQFIAMILRKMLDHKLKNKIIDKGVSEGLASSLLQTGSSSETHSSIKWFSILTTTGIGLFIVNQFLPLGIPSIGIMAISIATGFLVYSLYLNRFS